MGVLQENSNDPLAGIRARRHVAHGVQKAGIGGEVAVP